MLLEILFMDLSLKRNGLNFQASDWVLIAGWVQAWNRFQLWNRIGVFCRGILEGHGLTYSLGRLANSFQSCFVIPISHKKVPFVLTSWLRGVAIGGPDQLGAIWGKNREPIKTIGEGNTNGLVCALVVHNVEFEIGKPFSVGREDDIFP